MLSQANVIILFHSKCQAIWDKEGSFSLTSLFLFDNFRRNSSAHAGEYARVGHGFGGPRLRAVTHACVKPRLQKPYGG